MATIEQSIDVRGDDTQTHWRTKVAGKEEEFDAEIAEQTPDQRLGDALGLVERRVKGDLGRFEELIESRGTATGGRRQR